MSLFRKPKKPIQRRVFTADDCDDENDAEPVAPPPPIISRKVKPAKITSLLSFGDEEEESGEVFQVKKSKQSHRLAKRLKKEKKKGPEGDTNKNDNENGQPEPMEVDNHVPAPKAKKKVTLEGLILSGREALAADGAGDLSDDEERSGGEEEDSRGFHQYRAESVRAALAAGPGHIPDAALIHAARKTRQQARELGGDYIPVKPSEAKPGSRLVRDDDSGDEDGRIEVRGLELPSDKPKRGTAVGEGTEELDSEPDEWEEQQIKKAIPDITGAVDPSIEINPFALAPPPPPPPPMSAGPAHLRPLQHIAQQPPNTAQELVSALKKRLHELQVDRENTATKQQELKDRLLNAARIRESRGARSGALDEAYKRAQAARGYLTDLIECLDEKMPQLEALEARALAMHRRRCEFLMERRRADTRDQAQDVLALAARPGAAKPVDTEEKIRRAAEREGRRRARRLAREQAAAQARTAIAHRDGDSSDDGLPPTESQHCISEREAIRQQSSQLFADALPAWRDVAGVCAKLARWRQREPALYTDAYVADCLPKLLAPYVRHQLILWNPLADEDNEDFERMEWYRSLLMYGVRGERGADGSDSEGSGREQDGPIRVSVTEQSVRADPDLMLAPTILARVVLPKITELVEHAWDPMCVRACIRLRQLMIKVSTVPESGPALQRLAAAVKMKLNAALQGDVFLPALPPQIMEGPGGAFWRRCLGAGVRLLRSALALTGPPAILHADPIVISLIETLCCAAGAAPPQSMCGAAVALAESLPRGGPLRARALKRIAQLATLALSRLETDNPLHLRYLEQARNVIADAKAME